MTPIFLERTNLLILANCASYLIHLRVQPRAEDANHNTRTMETEPDRRSFLQERRVPDGSRQERRKGWFRVAGMDENRLKDVLENMATGYSPFRNTWEIKSSFFTP